VFVCTGFDNPSLLAIRPDGQGDVTETHVEWSLQQGVPLTPSPLVVGDELYLFNDGGVATCLEAKSGRRLWRQRIAGKFSASPVYADGRIYIQAENGVTHVLAPGPSFKRLATNRLPGETLATMAVAGSALYIRTEHALYRIENPPAEGK
jgi:outer membrane protein assembly factor BamB